MLKKKILPVAMILSALFLFGACSSVVEKEPEQKEPPVSEDVQSPDETDPVGLDEEIIEISEENEDQVVDLAMFAFTNFFNKSESFSDEDRREALSGITHPDYIDHLEMQHQLLDNVEFMKTENIEILGTEIQEEDNDGHTVKKHIVAFGYNESYKESGKEVSDEYTVMAAIIMVHDNQLKLSGFANINSTEE